MSSHRRLVVLYIFESHTTILYHILTHVSFRLGGNRENKERGESHSPHMAGTQGSDRRDGDARYLSDVHCSLLHRKHSSHHRTHSRTRAGATRYSNHLHDSSKPRAVTLPASSPLRQSTSCCSRPHPAPSFWSSISTAPAHAGSSEQYLRREQGGTGFGGLALRRRPSAPERAPGCPQAGQSARRVHHGPAHHHGSRPRPCSPPRPCTTALHHGPALDMSRHSRKPPHTSPS